MNVFLLLEKHSHICFIVLFLATVSAFSRRALIESISFYSCEPLEFRTCQPVNPTLRHRRLESDWRSHRGGSRFLRLGKRNSKYFRGEDLSPPPIDSDGAAFHL